MCRVLLGDRATKDLLALSFSSSTCLPGVQSPSHARLARPRGPGQVELGSLKMRGMQLGYASVDPAEVSWG